MTMAPDSADEPRLLRIIPAIGIAQIIAWGSLFYSIGVLGVRYREGLGLPEILVFGALTVALLISGSASPLVGRLVERYGGRRILSAGSMLGAASSLCLAVAPNAIVFCLAWVLTGVAMAASLYEPAFATLHQLSETHYRRSVTILSLFGGLAITIFWPLTHMLEQAIGWRATLATFAALQLLVCLPLHWFIIPPHRPPAPAPATSHAPQEKVLPHRAAFALLAVAFSCSTFVFSSIASRLIDLLTASGLTTTDAIVAAALIGPAQITGRVVELVWLRGIRAATLAVIAFGTVSLALLMLTLWDTRVAWVAGFACLFGFGNGMITIVRGALPQELLGSKGLAIQLGRLARPAFFAMALAPLIITALLARGLPPRLGFGALALISLGGLGCVIAARGLGATFRRQPS
jgi:MFS family permease